jgi:hypothetical protein
MHQMNDYQRDMINQRHQHDMHNAQHWRQAHTSHPDPAPQISIEARPSIFVRFIAATAQRIRRVFVNARQPHATATHRIETPGEFR